MGTDSGAGGAGGRARGFVLKAIALFAGVLLYKRLRRSATRWDHARAVAQSLCGEKFSREQACRDSDNYFNLRVLYPAFLSEGEYFVKILENGIHTIWRMLTCPATEMVDGSSVLYFEQAFWRTPQKPFRQRLYIVKPCPKELKCDVELSSYAIRETEEYKNFCDRPKDQRPHDEEIIGDIAEHLTTIHLSRCERGKRCLYEGSTSPQGFPNSWNGASYCTSDLMIHRNGEVHTWDRGYDEEGNQVWGPRRGPYEFKPAPNSSYDDICSQSFFN